MRSIPDHMFLSFDLMNFFFNVSRTSIFPIDIARVCYIAPYSVRVFPILCRWWHILVLLPFIWMWSRLTRGRRLFISSWYISVMFIIITIIFLVFFIIF